MNSVRRSLGSVGFLSLSLLMLTGCPRDFSATTPEMTAIEATYGLLNTEATTVALAAAELVPLRTALQAYNQYAFYAKKTAEGISEGQQTTDFAVSVFGRHVNSSHEPMDEWQAITAGSIAALTVRCTSTISPNWSAAVAPVQAKTTTQQSAGYYYPSSGSSDPRYRGYGGYGVETFDPKDLAIPNDQYRRMVYNPGDGYIWVYKTRVTVPSTGTNCKVSGFNAIE